VNRTPARPLILAIGVLLIAATHNASRVGYVDLGRLVASHPLYPVLSRYDREIAALRSTESLPGLGNPAAQAERGAGTVQQDASAASRRAEGIASRSAGEDGAQERAAAQEILASQRAGDRDVAAYTAQLVRETNANLENYRLAIAERTERAFAARQQQLHEKELTLAFDLARRNGGKRLLLRLKLADLHLRPADRAKLHAQLAALDQSEFSAVSALRRSDETVLESYRDELQREAETANARMAEELRAKAGANFAIRHHVGQVARSAGAPVDLPSQLAAFRANDAGARSADGIVAGLQTASGDLSQRLRSLGATDRQSQRETVAQIAALEESRTALYRSIVAQITREADRLARERQLSSVVFSRPQRDDSVDLTAAVKAALAGF
jgi:hypothetical protein